MGHYGPENHNEAIQYVGSGDAFTNGEFFIPLGVYPGNLTGISEEGADDCFGLTLILHDVEVLRTQPVCGGCGEPLGEYAIAPLFFRDIASLRGFVLALSKAAFTAEWRANHHGDISGLEEAMIEVFGSGVSGTDWDLLRWDGDDEDDGDDGDDRGNG